jgi:hypothetical protein
VFEVLSEVRSILTNYAIEAKFEETQKNSA